MNINEYEESIKEESISPDAELTKYCNVHDKVTAIVDSFVRGLITKDLVESRLMGLIMDGLIKDYELGYEKRSVIVTFLSKNQKRFCLW